MHLLVFTNITLAIAFPEHVAGSREPKHGFLSPACGITSTDLIAGELGFAQLFSCPLCDLARQKGCVAPRFLDVL